MFGNHYDLSINLSAIHVLHCVEGVGVRLVLNVGEALVQPRTLTLATKLDLFDLSKCGKNLLWKVSFSSFPISGDARDFKNRDLQMILIDVPCQPPNVDLRRLEKRKLIITFNRR